MSTCFDPRRRQRGDMMLEALVGVLITSIIGAGLAHVASRVLSGQRDAKVENIAVEQLRAQLESGGISLCDGGAVTIRLPGGDKAVAVDCEVAAANITVAGITRAVDAPQRVELRVAAADLGIGDENAPLIVSSRQ